MDDLPGASIPASRLHEILKRVDGKQPLSVLQQDFLQGSGLIALLQASLGNLGEGEFAALAMTEQERRVSEAAVARKAEEEEKRLQQKASDQKNAELFARRESKRARRKLFDDFGLGYVDSQDFGRLRHILQQVAKGAAINEVDLAWLAKDGGEYWTDELSRAHHKNLAEEITQKWRKTRDPWKAVTACSHWRKAKRPSVGLDVAGEALARNVSPKERSALLTTSGGALRDLARREEALERGLEAHALCPDDYRPCTLLGAVYIENHSYSEGAVWYEKAEARAANRDLVDREIRSLIVAARPEHREKIRKALKAHDAFRFEAF